MTSLPTSLTVTLTAITSQLGDSQVVNVFTGLWLYLEHNKVLNGIPSNVLGRE